MTDGTWLHGVLVLTVAIVNAGAAATSPESHPPIPVAFELREAGFVTLVIEDSLGRRVRNLIAETPFTAGPHTVYWDGLDESGKIPGPRNGTPGLQYSYQIKGKLVEAGSYRVRGLYHKGIDVRHEMAVYNEGNPPWRASNIGNSDKGGGRWLADHTPPSGVLYVPEAGGRIYVVSPVAEAGDGLVWLDLNGRKLGGRRNIGGPWTGATYIARDRGPKAIPGVLAYTAVGFRTSKSRKEETDETQLRLAAIRDGEELPLKPYVFKKRASVPYFDTVTGIAVHNGLLVASLGETNELLFLDARTGDLLAKAPLNKLAGLEFDGQGRLLALSAGKLLRFVLPGTLPAKFVLPDPQTLIAQGLEDPQVIAVDKSGDIYVSDWDGSHQVKVFDVNGRPVRIIGQPGGAKAGPYDPTRMDHPRGITLSDDGHLWVAESSKFPKRVSVWTKEGTFVRAFYGPPAYGGGGQLNPQKDRLFYSEPGCGMEFRLDWGKGTWDLTDIYYLHKDGNLVIGLDTDTKKDNMAPERPVYVNGQLYMANDCHVKGGRSSSVVGFWKVRSGVAVPVAAVGIANRWEELHKPEFVARMGGITFEELTATTGKKGKNNVVRFAWTDFNGDGNVQPEEVTFAPGGDGGYANQEGFLVYPDMRITTSFGLLIKPKAFTPAGAPIFDLSQAEHLVKDPIQYSPVTGGSTMQSSDGWVIADGGPIKGYRDGHLLWTYPNCWPSSFCSACAPRPTHPGEIVVTNGTMGPPVRPCVGESGDLWIINGNLGNAFMLTSDGLYIQTLFEEQRAGRPRPASAHRGMLLNQVSMLTECYFPSLTQTADGEIYMVIGKEYCGIAHLEGFQSIRRLPTWELPVTQDNLKACTAYLAEEARRQKPPDTRPMLVRIAKKAPIVDGQLDDWNSARWVKVDGSTEAAAMVAGDRLYVAVKSAHDDYQTNRPESFTTMFKSGGGVDVMLATDPTAANDRREAGPGDLRLLVSLVGGKPKEVLFRAVVRGTKDPVVYESPIGSVSIDKVEDVTTQAVFRTATTRGEKKGRSYNIHQSELSIPLTVFGLKVVNGLALRGDVGILRGDGMETIERLYWHNKATGLTADLPTEARLAPNMWGEWKFEAE